MLLKNRFRFSAADQVAVSATREPVKRGRHRKLSRTLAIAASVLSLGSFIVNAAEEPDVPIPDHDPKAANVMFVGQTGGTKLWPLKSLEKGNKRLTFEVNGNLVLYVDDQAVWSTQTESSCPGWAELSPFTGLTVYDCRQEVAYRQFVGYVHSNFHLELSNNGLSLYNMDERKKVWSVPLDQCNEYPCGHSNSSESIDTAAVRDIWNDQGWDVPMPGGETGLDQNFDAFLHHFSDFEKNGNHADAHRYLKALANQKCYADHGVACSGVFSEAKKKIKRWIYGNDYVTRLCVWAPVMATHSCEINRDITGVQSATAYARILKEFSRQLEDGTLDPAIFFQPWENFVNDSAEVVYELREIVELGKNRLGSKKIGQRDLSLGEGFYNNWLTRLLGSSDRLSRIDVAFEGKGSFKDIREIALFNMPSIEQDLEFLNLTYNYKEFDSIQVRVFGSIPSYDEATKKATYSLTMRLMNLMAGAPEPGSPLAEFADPDMGLSVNHEYTWIWEYNSETGESTYKKTTYSSSLGVLGEVSGDLLRPASWFWNGIKAFGTKTLEGAEWVADIYRSWAQNEDSRLEGVAGDIEMVDLRVTEQSAAVIENLSDDVLQLLNRGYDLDALAEDSSLPYMTASEYVAETDSGFEISSVDTSFYTGNEGWSQEVLDELSDPALLDELSNSEEEAIRVSVERGDSVAEMSRNIIGSVASSLGIESSETLVENVQIAVRSVDLLNRLKRLGSQLAVAEAGLVAGVKTTYTLREIDDNGDDRKVLRSDIGFGLAIGAFELMAYGGSQYFLRTFYNVPAHKAKVAGLVNNWLIGDTAVKAVMKLFGKADFYTSSVGLSAFFASKPDLNKAIRENATPIQLPSSLPQLWMPDTWDTFDPVIRGRIQVNWDLTSPGTFAWRHLEEISSQQHKIVSPHHQVQVPVLINQLQTFNELDTAYIQTRKNLDSTVKLVLDEELTHDIETTHEAEMMAGVGFREGNILDKHGLTIGEAGVLGSGKLQTGETQQFNMTLEFKNRYINPIVVLHVSDQHLWNWDKAVLKTANKTSSSVDIVIQEWERFADEHRFLDEISYLVIEAGTHRLQSGELLSANEQYAYGWTFNRASFEYVNGAPFAFDSGSSPVVFTQVNSDNPLQPPVIARIRGVNEGSFEMILQLEENNTNGPYDPNADTLVYPEKIWQWSNVDYIAIETGIPVEPEPTYCGASGGHDEVLGYINYVDLEARGKVSGQEGYSITDDTGMTIQRGTTPFIGLMTLNPNDVILPQNLLVYIDYNQDGNFDDIEKVLHETNIFSAWKNIPTVPSDAKVGKTRARFIFNHLPGSSDACGNFGSGEVEDYTITVE